MNVATWLSDLGLGVYVRTFADNDVDAATLRQLTEGDLTEMGLRSVGHRRKLMEAIAKLREGPQEAPAAVELTQQSSSHLQAEHRQLTVLYCDMTVPSAQSSSEQDEELRAPIRSFHSICTRIVADYDGHVANFYGDCLLAYFGWPRAHEDDAERAVWAGLALLRAISRLSASGQPISARAGIATGDVVVGDLIRQGPAREQSAVGLTPNLGARMLGLAGAGEVVIDELTRRLLPSSFALRPLGKQTLKGLSGPVAAYAVVKEYQPDSRFDGRSGKNLAPMIGRDRELALLMERWGQAQGGEGSAALLVGEAGIGKSRLTRALLDASADQANVTILWQCSPYHLGSALWPVIQRLSRMAGLQDDDSAAGALDKLEVIAGSRGETAALYATLLGLNGTQRYGPLEMTAQMLRERTLEVLVEQLYAIAEQRALLLVVEDAHWIDPTTLELLVRCLERIDRARLFMLITSRVDNQPVLGPNQNVVQLSLNRLSRFNVQNLVTRLGGEGLTARTLSAIVAQTDGVPLYVEELTKAVLESGEMVIPASLHGSLMARLDRMPEAKEIAQIAACIGREFDQALLKAASRQTQAVDLALPKLVASEIIYQRGDRSQPRFLFKHALVQEAAYKSLLRGRQQEIHGRILEALDAGSTRTPNEILAHHAAGARQWDKALGYWRQAGLEAMGKSAYEEGKGFLERAIELLRSIPDGVDRRTLEVDLLQWYGTASLTTIGAPPAKRAYLRARQLLDEIGGEPPQRLAVHYGLFNLYTMGAEPSDALELAISTLATYEPASDAALIARRWIATAHSLLGNFASAEKLFEQVMPRLNASAGQASALPLIDQRVAAHYQYGWVRTIQGFPDQGEQLWQRAHALCTPQSQASQWVQVFFFQALRAAIVRDPITVKSAAVSMREVGTKLGVFGKITGRMYAALADVFVELAGAIECRLEPHQIARFEHALQELEAVGYGQHVPFFMGTFAIGMAASGRHHEAATLAERALRMCEETSQGWCTAELWRIRGELHLLGQGGSAASADKCFAESMRLSRLQGARLWELRTAASLARAWKDRGEQAGALNVLQPIFECYSEGFDSGDLLEARALLKSLVSTDG